MADSLQNRINGTGLEPLVESTTHQPTAQALGATPQQTAMTGSAAQKAATIAERVDSTQAQKQELSRAARLAPKERELTVDEAEEVERQEQLAKLGNIGIQVQNSIDANLNAISQMEEGSRKVEGTILAQMLGIDAAQVELDKQDPNSNYNKITSSLNTFLDSGNPNDMEAALAAIDSLKLSGMTSADAKQLVGLTQDTMAKRTGQQVAENVLDQITLKDINLQELGFEQGTAGVAEALGMDPSILGDLSIDEFADAIEGKRKAEFSRVDNLKAELAAAPMGSLQREVLLRELSELGQVGITGVEAEAVTNVEDIDLASYVKVGDETVKVSDFLSDDGLSDMVSNWLAESDPIKKDEIISPDQFPELISWLNNNREALSELSETAGESTTSYNQANEDYKNLKNTTDSLGMALTDNVMSAIMPNYDPSKKVTSSEMETIQAKFNATPIGAIALDTTMPKNEKLVLTNKLNAVSEEELATISNMTAEEVKIASAAADALADSPDLRVFFGDSLASGKFIFDEAAQNQIAEYDNVLARINTENPAWLQEGAELNAMRGMTPEQLEVLADNPQRYEDLTTYLEKKDSFTATDADGQLKDLFGNEDLTLADIQEIQKDARKWAFYGDVEAAKRASALGELFGVGNGLVTEQAVSSLYANAAAGVNKTLDEVLAGKLSFTSPGSRNEALTTLASVSGPALGSKLEKYSQFIDNGAISERSLASMTPGEEAEFGKWLDGQSKIKVDLNGHDNYRDYSADKNERRFMDKSNRLAEESGFNNLDSFNKWMDRVKAPGGWLDATDMNKLQKFASKVDLASEMASTELQRNLYREVLADINTVMSWEQELLARKQRVEGAAARASATPTVGQVDLMPTFTEALPREEDLDPNRQRVVLGGPSFPFSR